MRLFQLFSFFLFSTISFGQDGECLSLSDWKTVAFPSDDDFNDLNSSDYDWVVFKTSGAPTFCEKKYPDNYGDKPSFNLDSVDRNLIRENHIMTFGNRHFLKHSDGWLVGTNKGEWGGTLFWVSNDLKDVVRIASANVNQLFYWNKQVFVLEGLSHLGMRGGHLLSVSSDLNIDTLITFEQTPYSADWKDENTLFIMTASTLYSVNQSFQKTELYQKESWPYLYPSSIAYYENQLYIAMRGGVAVYNTINQKMNWMIPR